MNVSGSSIPHMTVVSVSSPDSESGKYVELVCRLHGDDPSVFRDSTVFPPGRDVEIRKVETRPDGTASVFMKGAGRKSIAPGTVVVPSEYSASFTRTAYGIVLRRPDGNEARTDAVPPERDVAYRVVDGLLGIGRTGGEEIRSSLTDGGFRMTFSRHVLLCPGIPVHAIERNGGNRRVVFLPVIVQPLSGERERSVKKRLKSFPQDDPGIGTVRRFRAAFDGYSRLPVVEREAMLKSGLPGGFIMAGELLVLSSWLEDEEKKAFVRIERMPGIGIGDLAGQLGIERRAAETVVRRLAERALVKNEYGRLYPVVASGGKGEDLSPAARNVRARLVSLDTEGIRRKDPGYRTVGAVIDELIGKGYAVQLTEDLVYSREALESCVGKIRAGGKPGHELTVREIKDILGLSRTYVLPIIDELARTGILERAEGTLRIAEP